MPELIVRTATEEDYNARSRAIQLKVSIYFNGLQAEPFEVTKDDYLIDSDILEEACADSSNPFGEVSANEVSFTLFNKDGMFSPTNNAGPYYGLIKVGIPIRVSIRPAIEGCDIKWDPLGQFYVSDWSAAITGTSAYVTACDSLYDVFSAPPVKLPVKANESFHDLFRRFFEAMNMDADVDPQLIEKLVYAYTTNKNAAFLNDLSLGSQAFIFCDRTGRPKVKYARAQQPVDHELRDSDQIIAVSSRQSALLEYDGAEVVMNEPQQSPEKSLLRIKDFVVPPGQFESTLYSFKDKPIVRLTRVAYESDVNVLLTRALATCLDIKLFYSNRTTGKSSGELNVFGTKLETVSTSFISDTKSTNPLSVDSPFIQNKAYAEKFLKFLEAYVTNRVPVLDVTIRGNPLYLPGDKLHLVSEKYNLDYTGVLLRQQLKFDGGLHASIKLFNSKILEVI